MTKQKVLQRNTPNELSINDRQVSGYAIVFDKWSDGLPFKEIIQRGAIDENTIKESDVFAKLNHRDDVILARSKYGEGSLQLSIDKKGLKYSFSAPNTEWGETLLEHIRRGEIDQSSFAFTIADGGSVVKRNEDGELEHYITKIDKLYDISPVYQAAYSATNCENRNADEKEELLEKLRKNEIIDKINSIETEFLLSI